MAKSRIPIVEILDGSLSYHHQGLLEIPSIGFLSYLMGSDDCRVFVALPPITLQEPIPGRLCQGGGVSSDLFIHKLSLECFNGYLEESYPGLLESTFTGIGTTSLRIFSDRLDVMLASPKLVCNTFKGSDEAVLAVPEPMANKVRQDILRTEFFDLYRAYINEQSSNRLSLNEDFIEIFIEALKC